MKIKSIITGFVLTLGHLAFSQANFDQQKLDQYFKNLSESNKFLGTVEVTKNGKKLYQKSIGFQDIDKKIPSSENTKYRIGSISKTFTSVLIFKAIEDQKLSLNQTIEKWFPTIKNADKITIKQLLGHRSGIHDFTYNDDYLEYNTKPKSEKEMVSIIEKSGIDFEPDSKSVYSNSNYILLTYILEHTYKKSYSKILEKYITKPLKLKDTYLFGEFNPSKNEAKSYKYFGGWKLESDTHYSIPLGAGAISSTAHDINKFADALFNGKLISATSLEAMKTIQDNLGLGLFQMPFNNSIGYGHTGGIDGFSSVFSYFPEEKIAFTLTSNGTNVNNNTISIAVLSAIFNLPYEIPTYSHFDIKSEDLDQYLGTYSSTAIPIKVTFTKKDHVLIAQATGQPSFPLESTALHQFEFNQVGIKFEFNPSNKTMILFQGGGQFEFTKE